jgi:hypothetical protein
MTITVDVRPEVQAELARQAAVQGRPVELVAAALLESAVHLPAEQTPRRTAQEVPGLFANKESRAAKATNLMDLFEPIRGLLTDEEVDTLSASRAKLATL